MKTSILTALLVVGLLLQLAPPPTIGNPSTGAAASQHQAMMQTANAVEVNNAVGAGLTGCWAFVGGDGDTYAICCLDLWLFAVCVTVDYSAAQRLVNSVI